MLRRMTPMLDEYQRIMSEVMNKDFTLEGDDDDDDDDDAEDDIVSFYPRVPDPWLVELEWKKDAGSYSSELVRHYAHYK